MKHILLYTAFLHLPLRQVMRKILRTYFQDKTLTSGLHLSPEMPTQQAIVSG